MSNEMVPTDIDAQTSDRVFNQQYQRIKLTHPAEYLCRITNSYYLKIIVCLLVILYLGLISISLVKSSHLFILIKKEISNKGDEQKLIDILAEIHHDRYYCSHCIEYHIGFQELQRLIREEESRREVNLALKTVRTMFNILSMTNTIIVYLIFGGPKLISVVTLLSSACIFGSIYVKNLSDAVIFESTVLLGSLVVLLKSISTIMDRNTLLDEKRKKKTS